MKTFLYEVIARNITLQIEKGTLRPGDKLPSIRSYCKQQAVSPSTIFQAYYQLEAKGLVEARPRSGYYVCLKKSPAPLTFRETGTGKMDLPVDVNTSEIMEEVEIIRGSEAYLQFANAIPSLSYLPSARLRKATIEAIRDQRKNLLPYEEIGGNKELRGHLVLQSMKWGGAYTIDDILITSGCIEALSICLKAVTNPGDIIAMEELTNYTIYQLAKSLQLKIIPIPVKDNDGIDIGYLEEALGKFDIKACLFTTNFHNPTGYCIPEKQKRRLVDLITAHQIPLIEDDIFGELFFGKHRPSTCKRFDNEGWVLYCSSFSKTLAPGYRVGYCIPGRFMREVYFHKRTHSLGTNSLTQATLVRFMEKERYDFHLRKIRNILHINEVNYLRGILKYFPDEVELSPPEGGFIFWIRFPVRMNSYRLFQKAREQNIGIIPGQLFSISDDYKNFIRLSFALPYSEIVEKGLKIVGGLSKELMEAKQM